MGKLSQSQQLTQVSSMPQRQRRVWERPFSVLVSLCNIRGVAPGGDLSQSRCNQCVLFGHGFEQEATLLWTQFGLSWPGPHALQMHFLSPNTGCFSSHIFQESPEASSSVVNFDVNSETPVVSSFPSSGPSCQAWGHQLPLMGSISALQFFKGKTCSWQSSLPVVCSSTKESRPFCPQSDMGLCARK